MSYPISWSKRIPLYGAVILWSLFTWGILVYHYSDLKPPVTRSTDGLRVSDYGKWIDKKEAGIHQLILQGPPFERGWAAGQLTKELMLREEEELITRFRKIVPSDFALHIFQVLGIRWFWGVDSHFAPHHLEEMYGTSFAAPEKFNYLLPAYTRQLAYHGLHEVGQMMVDRNGGDFGCTVLASPHPKGGWVVGRNFDFEAGGIFDDEKIMKWVFPDKGYAFLSVVWAGMVGAVTGVNEHGVYISMNAAGTQDYVRFGTPTTLVLLEALQRSRTAREAADFIEDSQFFITDIFVVADGGGELYQIEKSPKRYETFIRREPVAIANHLVSSMWKDDSVNRMRATALTSHYRLASGERIIKNLNSQTLVQDILKGLRDKRAPDGSALPLGNRRAIDALIATHGVLYDSQAQKFYVSQGPALTGEFVGFDLKKSFATRQPVRVENLPADPEASPAFLAAHRTAQQLATEARARMRQGQCAQAEVLLKPIPSPHLDHAYVQQIWGDVAQCLGRTEEASAHWQKALDAKPSYRKDEEYLRHKL